MKIKENRRQSLVMALKTIAVKGSAVLFICCALLISCKTSPKVTGEIEIDFNSPIATATALSYGVVFTNEGNGERAALDYNLIYNSSFNLGAYVPPLCRYSSAEKSLTTPNGYTLPYPEQGVCTGWEVEKGRLDLVSDKEQNHLMRAVPIASDSVKSVCRILSNRADTKFSVAADDRMTLRFKARGLNSPVTLRCYIEHRDSLRISSPIEAMCEGGDKFGTFSKELKADLSADSAYLVIETTGAVELDDVSLFAFGYNKEQEYALPKGSLELLKQLNPSFTSFPGGGLADGYYEETYYDWASDSSSRSLWTLQGNEFTQQFLLPHFLSLSKEIKSMPLYVANSGITSIKALPRHESVSELPNRTEKLRKAIGYISKNTTLPTPSDTTLFSKTLLPKIVFGSGMRGEEYTRRFLLMHNAFSPDSTGVELIPGGVLEIWPTPNFSFAHTTQEIQHTDSFIASLPPERDSLVYMRQPELYGEISFPSVLENEQVRWPQLVDRMLLIIELEKRREQVKGIAFSPLFADRFRWDTLPLFYTHGGVSKGSSLYELLLRTSTNSGSKLHPSAKKKVIPDTIDDLHLSCTSSADDGECYIKAVNTTRHELIYKINLKNTKREYKHLHITRFRHKHPESVPQTPQFEVYEIESETSLYADSALKNLTISPYELIILKLF